MSGATAAAAIWPYPHRTMAEVDRRNEIIAAYVAGGTLRSVGDMFGLRIYHVRGIMVDAGVPRRPANQQRRFTQAHA